mgnify:FL=1
MPKNKTTETRLAKVSGGLADIRLSEDVLKAFYAHDLQKLESLLKIIHGRSYSYRFHKLKQRSSQGSPLEDSGLFDISFAFIEER